MELTLTVNFQSEWLKIEKIDWQLICACLNWNGSETVEFEREREKVKERKKGEMKWFWRFPLLDVNVPILILSSLIDKKKQVEVENLRENVDFL